MDAFRRSWKLGLAVIVLAGAAWGTVHAQGPGQASSGQMAELISEVKLMRAALQEMASSQSQMQALGLQLNAQQARITQVSASLDAANAQLSEVASRAKDAARERRSTIAEPGLAADVDACRRRAALADAVQPSGCTRA